MTQASDVLPLPPGLGGPPGSAEDEGDFSAVPVLNNILKPILQVPGYQFALVSITNVRWAQRERGWFEYPNFPTYRISGPRGFADVKLMYKGKRIQGQAHNSGKRMFGVDISIQWGTGLWIKPEDHEGVPVPLVDPNTVPKELIQKAPAPKPTPAKTA